ncbi:MAG TPA: molybdenum ABC transporter ATP-binding protein [Acidobacteriota bacterium]|nr:molybdenum ABC transporter ATP-binding protein [Acidobacteriota bacterium]
MIEITARKRLADFHLDVEINLPGEPVAVFGPSGAGKSTLLNIVAGLLRPDSGRISIDGEVLFDSAAGIDTPAERRGFGLVPQEGLLFPHRTVRENLLYGYRRVRGRPRTIELNEVAEVLEIGSLLDRYPATLSGGEAQRVALGRALLASPRLLLFDEPLASVDGRLKWRILPYLKLAISHFNLPALYVSHDPTEVTSIASHIAVLHGGRIVAAGPYREIIDLPEVYGIFTREGVNNVLAGTVDANLPEYGYSVVSVGEATFKVALVDAPPGAEIGLAIRANEIIISRGQPGKISTRNVLRGRVAGFANVGSLILVHVDIGCELIVELTHGAATELLLAEGTEIWVLIKSNAFQIHSTLRPA